MNADSIARVSLSARIIHADGTVTELGEIASTEDGTVEIEPRKER